MGVGTFYSEEKHLIVDNEFGNDIILKMSEEFEDNNRFSNVNDILNMFKKYDYQYDVEDIEQYIEIVEKNNIMFDFETWKENEIEMQREMLMETLGVNFSNRSSVVDNAVVIKNIEVIGGLFVTEIEIDFYGDNYHNAIIGTTVCEQLNEYIADGTDDNDFIMELVGELDSEIYNTLDNISDYINDIEIAYEKENLDDFLNSYEKVFELIKDMIKDISGYKETKQAQDFLNILANYEIQFKNIQKINLNEKEFFRKIVEEPFNKLTEYNILFNKILKMIKTDLNNLISVVDYKINVAFNKLIATNPIGLFRARTSNDTSETIKFYNSEEDMKKALEYLDESTRKYYLNNLKKYENKYKNNTLKQ